MILDCPDERVTPELLTKWVKEAKNSVGLKMLVGALDTTLDKEIIAVIGLLANSKITLSPKGREE